MPSFANTFRRCHSTVRALMKSCAPISGFVRPSRASRAICSSCGVSAVRVSGLRLRTFSPVATSSRRARSANASMPIASAQVVRRAQLLARVEAATLAAQPLAVHQMRSGELRTQPGPTEPFDRLAIQKFRVLAIA